MNLCEAVLKKLNTLQEQFSNSTLTAPPVPSPPFCLHPEIVSLAMFEEKLAKLTDIVAHLSDAVYGLVQMSHQCESAFLSDSMFFNHACECIPVVSEGNILASVPVSVPF